MNTRQSRPGVWAITLLTCLALFGGQSAFAWEHGSAKPRVEAAGWICKPDPLGKDGCAEVKLGITAKTNKANMADGRFDYMNRLSKYNVKGRINSLTVNPNPTPGPSHPCFTSAVFFDLDNNPLTPDVQVGGAPLDQPYANVSGTCDDGDSCTFDATVVDDDSGKHKPDYVCNLHMHGMDKKGKREDYDDPGQPLQHGKVEVHPE